MKLYQQLVLFVLGATVIPLVVGFVILYHNEKQLRRRLLESRRESVQRLAQSVADTRKEIFERLSRAVGLAPPGELSPEELSGWLGIVYKQSEDIIQVALLDDGRREQVPAILLDHPERYPEYSGRLAVDEKAHQRFLQHLPWKLAHRARAGSIVVGQAYRYAPGKLLVLGLLAPVEVASGRLWYVAVELSLQRLGRRVVEWGEGRGWQAWLADGNGRLLAHPDEQALLARADMTTDPAWVRKDASGARAFLVGEALHAVAPVPYLGWTVVLSQQASEALAGVRRARRVTLGWTGLSVLALLVAGAFFTRRITARVGKLVRGAETFGQGQLDTRVQVRGADEIALLANTFNRMAEQLEKSRREIERWNRELADRVEERTRELEIAHRRLLETSKLAAIGQLGAGVAHEINNPLVGILGNVQLMLVKYARDDDQSRDTLRKIEAAAKRCREVVQNLLRFSEQDQEADHVDVELGRVLEDAYSLTAQQMEELGIAVRWQVEPGIKILGDHRQLMRAFLNILVNARTAMRETGGLLKITVSHSEESAVVEFADSGKGIDPEQVDRIFEPFFTTKDVWTNTGLGLSVTYRVITDHGGQIEVDSQPGKGTRFTVKLPVLQKEQA